MANVLVEMANVWREAVQLDHIQLPEPDERDPEWQVAYWCEAPQHTSPTTAFTTA